ncbi:MAG: ABC transporter substrate-binding protein [Caldilineaceae bacterium]
MKLGRLQWDFQWPLRCMTKHVCAKSLLFLLLSTTLSLLTSCAALLPSAIAQEPIKIGIIAPFTGPLAASGESTWRGMLLAADEINEGGGVLGRPIEILMRNVGEDSAAGEEAAIELADAGAVAVFGGIYDMVILDYLDELHAHSVLFVNTWATIPTIVKNGYDPNLAFCLAAADTEVVSMLAQFTVDTLHAQKPAILAEDSPWGDSTLTGLDEMLRQLGVAAPLMQRFHVGEPDIVAEVDKVRQAGADALIMIARSDEAAAIVRSTESLGWKVPVIGHPTTKAGNFTERVGVTAINGVYVLQPKGLFSYDNPTQTALLEAYRKLFGAANPQITSHWEGVARGYDGVQLLAKAIEQAQSVETLEIVHALEQLKTNYSGILKEYASPFSSEIRNAFTLADYTMAQWQQGQLILAPLPSAPTQ